MKVLILSLITAFTFSADFKLKTKNPKKGTYQVFASEKIHTTKEKLWDMMSQSDEFCEKGCRYHMPNVTDIRLVKKENNIAYTWTFVDNFIDAEFYNRSQYTETADGFISHTTTPSSKEIAELKKISGLKHDPIFYSSSVKTTVKEVMVDGDFSHLFITYEVEMKTKKWTVNAAKKKVLKGLSDAAKATFKNYRSLE